MISVVGIIVIAGILCCVSQATSAVAQGSLGTLGVRPPVGIVENDHVHDVLVVGGGLSGSTAAFYLNQRGIDVVLAEANAEMGGNMVSSRSIDGFQWEEGPNSFQPTATILRYAKDLNMLDELVLADSKLPRFVYWGDGLHKLPGGLKDFAGFSLLSFKGKLRASLGMLGLVRRQPRTEESIKDFTQRIFGREVFERLVDPFVSGVYAGDPTKLSMKAAMGKIHGLEGGGGLLLGGMTKFVKGTKERRRARERNADLPKVPIGSLGSFKRGMQSMATKVQERLGDKVWLSHRAVGVRREGAVWVTTLETPLGVKVVRSKALVVTLPSYAAAQLLGHSHPIGTGSSDGAGAGAGDSQPPAVGTSAAVLPEAADLSSIVCPPVAAVVLAYPDSAFKEPIKGFGHLIPRSMRVRTLGSIWSSSLFPGRAPPGYSVLTNFIGGAQDPRIVDLAPEQLVAQVHADLCRVLLKPDAAPPRVLAVRLWPRAIPQYNIGHQALLERVMAGLTRTPGLFLGGNYRMGVALGDCVQFGVNVADEVRVFLFGNTTI